MRLPHRAPRPARRRRECVGLLAAQRTCASTAGARCGASPDNDDRRSRGRGEPRRSRRAPADRRAPRDVRSHRECRRRAAGPRSSAPAWRSRTRGPLDGIAANRCVMADRLRPLRRARPDAERRRPPRSTRDVPGIDVDRGADSRIDSPASSRTRLISSPTGPPDGTLALDGSSARGSSRPCVVSVVDTGGRPTVNQTVLTGGLSRTSMPVRQRLPRGSLAEATRWPAGATIRRERGRHQAFVDCGAEGERVTRRLTVNQKAVIPDQSRRSLMWRQRFAGPRPLRRGFDAPRSPKGRQRPRRSGFVDCEARRRRDAES